MTTCCLQRRAQGEQRGDHVREADALQHAQDAPVEQPVDDALAERRVGDSGDVAPREVGEAVDEEPEEEDQRAAADDLRADGPLVVAAGAARARARGAS